jgi:hypothetical protein
MLSQISAMLCDMFTTEEWALKWLAGVAKSHARGHKTEEQLQGTIHRCITSYGLTAEQVRTILGAHGVSSDLV